MLLCGEHSGATTLDHASHVVGCAQLVFETGSLSARIMTWSAGIRSQISQPAVSMCRFQWSRESTY